MLKLGEVVKLDTEGEFHSDVQLSDYDRPERNRVLLRSYIFSTTAPSSFGSATNSIAGIDLLKQLTLGYTYAHGHFENRMVAIANYGHGKSHLALVLANYFAKPADSLEVKISLERIAQALNDPAKAEHYRDFKRERGEFLVLRLRGDTPYTLREQYFRALKVALSEHEQTANLQLPFWTKSAIQYLRALSGDNLAAANTYLANHQIDVPGLLHEVEGQREEAYELYIGVFKHLSHGIPPNTEGYVSLREAVAWTVNTCCGEGKLGGLLILFDEFSQYVQRYARSKAVGDLQDLLQGVEDHRGKAIFLAFAQHDPKEVARLVLSAGQQLQTLEKELDRLPRKYALYSLMESVLDSYLKQQEAWEQLLHDPKVKGALYGDASELAWEVFLKHYDQELGWTHDKFRKVVTEGCFPLHPLTTGLLCQLRMEQGEAIGGARTVLGFVSDQLELRAEQPAVVDGRPNWILPIVLVDYFERRLDSSGRVYAALEKAQHDLALTLQEAISPAHTAILKALLLYEVANMKWVGEKQVGMLAQLSGHDFQTTSRVLKELSSKKIIRYDPIQKVNSFWPIGNDPHKLEERIKQQIARLYQESNTFLVDLNRSLKADQQMRFGRVPIEVEWGHPEDWAANEEIITTEQLTPEYLKQLFTPFRFGPRGFEDGQRGLVLWIMMREDFDRDALCEQAKSAIDQAWPGEAPPPVLVVIPRGPVPEMDEYFRRKQALEQLRQDKDLKQEVGQGAFDHEVEYTRKALASALGQLRGDSEHVWAILRETWEIVVPTPYRISVSRVKANNLQRALEALYDATYRYRPEGFFTQYPTAQARGGSKLRPAVKNVARNLLLDRIGSVLAGMDNVARDLSKGYLSARWGILGPERGTFPLKLQKPTSLTVLRAWEQINNTFVPGQEVPVNTVLPRLLNPPYGFDYNTLLLLFSAWIGYHRDELQISARGRVIGVSDLEKWVETAKTPRDFLTQICKDEYLALSRRDPDADQQQVRELVRRVRNREKFSQHEAQESIGFLRAFAERDKQPTDVREQASSTAETLEHALKIAQDYDHQVQDIIERADRERTIDSLQNLCQRVNRLPLLEIVAATKPSPEVIAEHLERCAEDAFGWEQHSISGVKDLTQIGTLRDKLAGYRKAFESLGQTTYVEKCKELQNALEDRVRYLKAQAQEASIRNEIKAMTHTASLAELYKYQNRLQEIADVSQELAEERDRKMQAIAQEIYRLQTYAETISASVQAIELRELHQCRDEALKLYTRFSGTQVQAQLEHALHYLDLLHDFASQIGKVKVDALRTPEDVAMARAELSRIRSDFERGLSANHLNEVLQLEHQIESRVQSLQSEAVRWLEALERDEATLSTGELKLRLAAPPVFLPAECQQRLEALRARMQQRLDSDVIAQIEHLFEALVTPQMRQECLNRLQRLMHEQT